MKRIGLKRRLEESLSEGQGKQLLWLLAIIFVVILVFWLIIRIVFNDGAMTWQNLITLFLDPGSFGGAEGNHDIFRLIVALLGLFLFSALLISAVSNVFGNISDSFRGGHSRFHHTNHILILGGESHLFSMLLALLNEEGDEDIVVLTSQDVEDLRTRILSYPFLDKEKTAALRRRLTIYRGERDNVNDLARKDLSKKAKVIYIIGEENEIDSDARSIYCCSQLKEICKDTGRTIRCFLLLRDPSSILIFRRNQDKNLSGDLKVDVIDTNEYLAERVLVREEQQFPSIDYRITRDSSGKRVKVDGILEDSATQVQFVVVGMTDIGKAMALTAAHICHFPNYRSKNIRMVISFIDVEMKSKMQRFVAAYSNLFQLSNYRYVSFDDDGMPVIRKFSPDPDYGDFLDIEWEFFDADISDMGVRKVLEERASDDNGSLSFAFCRVDGKENAMDALSLPSILLEKEYPIFVYQQDSGKIIDQAGVSGRFGNLYAFGMLSDLHSDPLFHERTLGGQKVNFSYYRAKEPDKYPDDITAWFDLEDVFKFNSIFSANSMRVLNHNFHLLDEDISALTEEQWTPICDEEHRRWMMSMLILGFKALDERTRQKWGALAKSDNPEKRIEAAQQKKQFKKAFYHLNIMPYDDLPLEDQKADRDIIQNIKYILS